MLNKDRWKILPIWIKAIIVLYTLFNLLVLLGIVLTMLGYSFPMSIYGIYTDAHISLKGILIYSIFALKGVVGLAFITGKEWAVQLGIWDSILGIVLCILFGFIIPLFFNSSNTVKMEFRLEIVLMAFLIIGFKRVKEPWILS